MRHRVTGAVHGMVRAIKPDEWIGEGTWKEGKKHGLRRVVFDDRVVVALWKDSVQVARFEYDHKMEETERNDPFGLLNELSPGFFASDEI